MSLLIDLIFPRRCYGCGRPGQYLCAPCRSSIVVRSFKAPQAITSLDGHLAVFPYDYHLKRTVLGLKYQFASDVCEELSNFTVSTLKKYFPQFIEIWRAQNYVIIPVPLHLLRQNWRGFNQSELLSQLIAKKLSLNYIPDLSYRQKYTLPQVSQKVRSGRINNVASAFALNPKYLLIVPKNIIIFDDVFTTGSTIESLARVLKEYGAQSIIGLTLAG